MILTLRLPGERQGVWAPDFKLQGGEEELICLLSTKGSTLLEIRAFSKHNGLLIIDKPCLSIVTHLVRTLWGNLKTFGRADDVAEKIGHTQGSIFNKEM